MPEEGVSRGADRLQEPPPAAAGSARRRRQSQLTSARRAARFAAAAGRRLPVERLRARRPRRRRQQRDVRPRVHRPEGERAPDDHRDDHRPQPSSTGSDGGGVAPSVPAPEEEAPRGRVFEERQNQLAMAVESRRAADDRHDAVGLRQLEERVDLVVSETVGQQPQRELCLELRSEPFPPEALVLARAVAAPSESAASASPSTSAAMPGADQAVVDPAAGRRLDQSGGIADGEDAVGICLRRIGASGSIFEPRFRRASSSDRTLHSPSRAPIRSDERAEVRPALPSHISPIRAIDGSSRGAPERPRQSRSARLRCPKCTSTLSMAADGHSTCAD